MGRKRKTDGVPVIHRQRAWVFYGGPFHGMRLLVDVEPRDMPCDPDEIIFRETITCRDYVDAVYAAELSIDLSFDTLSRKRFHHRGSTGLGYWTKALREDNDRVRDRLSKLEVAIHEASYRRHLAVQAKKRLQEEVKRLRKEVRELKKQIRELSAGKKQ